MHSTRSASASCAGARSRLPQWTVCRAMLFYEPDKRDRELLPHDPFKAFIAPRPIGWVSTVGPDGRGQPRALLLLQRRLRRAADGDVLQRRARRTPRRSRARAASSSGTWPTWDLREQMNETSATLPRGESEFEHAGLEMAPSRLVAPPRVAAAHVALECRVTQVVALQDVDGDPAQNIVVFGQVVGVHVDGVHRRRAGRPDAAEADRPLRLQGRLRGRRVAVRDVAPGLRLLKTGPLVFAGPVRLYLP